MRGFDATVSVGLHKSCLPRPSMQQLSLSHSRVHLSLSLMIYFNQLTKLEINCSLITIIIISYSVISTPSQNKESVNVKCTFTHRRIQRREAK